MKSKYLCYKCENKVKKSDVKGYTFVCPFCNENFYKFQCKKVMRGFKKKEVKFKKIADKFIKDCSIYLGKEVSKEDREFLLSELRKHIKHGLNPNNVEVAHYGNNDENGDFECFNVAIEDTSKYVVLFDSDILGLEE